ncbi:MAG: DUF4912 domain-containing protein [Candidatus Eisenbacteria bacterium]
MKLSRVEAIRKDMPGRRPGGPRSDMSRGGRPDRRDSAPGNRGAAGRGGYPSRTEGRRPNDVRNGGGSRFERNDRPEHNRGFENDERALQAREHLRRSGEARANSGYTPQYERPREKTPIAEGNRPPSPPPPPPPPPARREQPPERTHGRPDPSLQMAEGPSRPGHPLELPESYGKDRLTLMVRDPYWIHAYWEVTPETIERAKRELGASWEGSRWILRVSSYPEDTGKEPEFFDIDLHADARNWYLRVPNPDRSYEGMIGVVTREGTFYPFARSNRVRTPRDSMSPVSDVEWTTTQEQFEKIYALSGGHAIGRSSFEAGEELRAPMQEAMFSGMLGSMNIGSGAMGGARRPRSFWFQLDTELVVYGATEPDAQVTVQGRPVALRPDGTFSVRFQLPDGVQEIPCVARSADGISEREITPTVRRNTNSSERDADHEAEPEI